MSAATASGRSVDVSAGAIARASRAGPAARSLRRLVCVVRVVVGGERLGLVEVIVGSRARSSSSKTGGAGAARGRDGGRGGSVDFGQRPVRAEPLEGHERRVSSRLPRETAAARPMPAGVAPTSRGSAACRRYWRRVQSVSGRSAEGHRFVARPNRRSSTSHPTTARTHTRNCDNGRVVETYVRHFEHLMGDGARVRAAGADLAPRKRRG